MFVFQLLLLWLCEERKGLTVVLLRAASRGAAEVASDGAGGTCIEKEEKPPVSFGAIVLTAPAV
eukprot:1722081-Rhodomonas_salina.3